MLAFLFAPVYLLFNFYIIRWALRWMNACSQFFKSKIFRICFVAVYAFVCLSLLTSFIITEPSLHRWLKGLSNYWLGTFEYILLMVIVVDVGRLILKRLKRIKQETLASRRTFVITGAVTVSLICSFSVYGIIHAKNVTSKEYDVTIEKTFAQEDMKIALVADLHLGYSIGEWHIDEMVKKINEFNPDLVCIAGDIFDNEYGAIKDPEKIMATLRKIQSKYGVYACYGNHDVSEKVLAGFTFKSKSPLKDDPQMEKFLADSNIKLLNDESILIDDAFYLYGRKDPARVRKIEGSRLTPEEITKEYDLSKPIIVMDHQPDQLQELADAGVDLDLSGHTHDGQMFPGNLTVKLAWENPCGMMIKDHMTSIVTSGIGVWGPNMRVGTNSEIVKINVHFTGASE